MSAVLGRNRLQQRRHRRSGQPAGARARPAGLDQPAQMPCWPPVCYPLDCTDTGFLTDGILAPSSVAIAGPDY
jgi:hypothetical protein